MKKYRLIMLPLIVIFFAGFFQQDSDIYFKINKSLDIFGKIYKEITLNYVDEIDPEEFMLAGVKGMLSYLDPYTIYLDENQQNDVNLITKGKYGGIGATIGLRNDKVTIVDLYEGYSAQRQGVRIGDVILKVDSVTLDKDNYENLSAFMKGKPGTEVSITVEREGEPAELVFNLIREEIEVKNLTYYGFVPENSGNVYLKLSGFSRTAGEEIKKALLELKSQKEIESIVLDLRGNPGGLLDAAIDVSEKFLGKDQLVVSVIGRDTLEVKNYRSNEEPVAEEADLAVLVDNSSASASEIVAGAIQDHDRGIIVGTQSFGKGLVQTIIPLSYNTSLKITTAKYYTPSGRCIQKINYFNKDIFKDKFLNEREEFKTDNDRKVFAAGGIEPDTVVASSLESEQIKHLMAQGMFFKFASFYFNTNDVANISEIPSEEIFGDFLDYIESQDFKYKSKPERLINELRSLAEKRKYTEKILTEITDLADVIEKVNVEELSENQKAIVQEIKKELAARLKGQNGRIEESLKYDEQFELAYNILQNNKSYKIVLNSSE